MTLVAWLGLVGCHLDRKEELEARVESLRAEVKTLQGEVRLMRGVLDGQPAPTAAQRKDHDPRDFQRTRPLPPGDPSRPDVLLLSIDTLRADHLGLYGYERDTSPFIDQLGRAGMVFEQAWSPAPWTLPSHATLLSGQLPQRHGAIEDHLRLADSVPLVQSAFQSAGFATFGAVSTLFVSSRYGFQRGFDHFEDFGILTKAQNNLATVDADHVFHHALHWGQRQAPGQPVFMFLHVYDVHYNYDAPPPYNERFDRAPQWGDELYKNYWSYKQDMVSAVQLAHQIAQYDEEIAFVDDMFRELVDQWRSAGRELLVMVTADHGEEFGERGSWGHAHTLWPEQLHVPLVVNGPGVVVGRSPRRIGTEDLAPTLAAMAGVSFRADDGEDRSWELRGQSRAPLGRAAEIAATSRFESMVLRWHDWPWDLYVDVANRQRSLCRLDEDPRCTSNVYKKHLKRGEAMFGELMDWLGEPWTAHARGRVEVEGGYIFASKKRHNQVMGVEPKVRFTVVPEDAKVTLHRALRGMQGPWQPMGGALPGSGCGLAYDGWSTEGNAITVGSDEREMLASLGYLQEDEEPAEAALPGGRQACR